MKTMTEEKKENDAEAVLGGTCYIREVSLPDFETEIPAIVLSELGINLDEADGVEVQFIKEHSGRIYIEKTEGSDPGTKNKVSIQKVEEINLIPDDIVQKILKDYGKERPIHSFDLSFEDGVNLAWSVILGIIRREDDEGGNMEGILGDHISEALIKITEGHSDKRVQLLCKHFNIELDQ